MIRISIYEGERPLVKDNHLLGTFDLTGIKKLPKGKAQIEVTFDIDDNGILSVTASDKESGSKNEITISNDSGRLSKEDIERMLREAEEFAEQDKVAKDRIDSKNALESYIYKMKSEVDDKEKLADKLSEEDKNVIREAVKDA